MARYWFKPRRYGYGAAPASWEGWLVSVVMVALVVVSIVAMNQMVDRSNFVAWLVWAAIIAGGVLGFARMARQRTDGEWRWRWGDDRGV